MRNVATLAACVALLATACGDKFEDQLFNEDDAGSGASAGTPQNDGGAGAAGAAGASTGGSSGASSGGTAGAAGVANGGSAGTGATWVYCEKAADCLDVCGDGFPICGAAGVTLGFCWCQPANGCTPCTTNGCPAGMQCTEATECMPWGPKQLGETGCSGKPEHNACAFGLECYPQEAKCVPIAGCQ